MIEKMPEQEPINTVGPKMLLPSEVCAAPLEQDIKNSGQGGVDAEARRVFNQLGGNNWEKFLEGWRDEDH